MPSSSPHRDWHRLLARAPPHAPLLDGSPPTRLRQAMHARPSLLCLESAHSPSPLAALPHSPPISPAAFEFAAAAARRAMAMPVETAGAHIDVGRSLVSRSLLTRRRRRRRRPHLPP